MQRPPPSQVRIATAACYSAFLALGMCATLIGPSFQNLTHRFNMRLEDGGIFTSLQFTGVVMSVILSGRLLDRINARYLLCGGTLLLGGGLLLLSIAPSLPIALLATLILGIGFGALDVSPNVVIADLNPNHAGAALNAVNVAFGVGAILGPQIVSLALRLQNFTLAFALVGVFTLLLTIPFLFVSVRVTSSVKRVGRQIRWLPLLPFVLILFFSVGSETGFGSWLFTQMTKIALATEATAAIATSLFYIGLTVGRVLAILILRWLTNAQTLLVAIIGMSMGVILLLSAPTVEGISLLSSFIVGLGCGPIFPTGLAIFSQAHPETRGTASGVLIALASTGGVVLPWLQGQVGSGRDGGMILTLTLAGVMLVMLFLIERQMRLVQAPERHSA